MGLSGRRLGLATIASAKCQSCWRLARRVASAIAGFALIWTLLAGGAVAQEPPTFVLGSAKAVSIEAADAFLRARMKNGAKSAPTRLAKKSARALSTSAVTCGTSTTLPVEITTLAAGLKCDTDLIFEYVYNNIEYEPLFGSNKGPLGTLLDQRGNDWDQTQLLAALLTAAGVPSANINYVYGYIRVVGTQGSTWLGVKNDGNAIGNLLVEGGIPINTAQWLVNGDKTLNRIDVAHVWLQVQISGTNYVFDPSFKQHSVKSALTGLGSILGYTQSQFLTDAGGTIDSVSIGGINRAQVRADLTTYATNLIGYIKANNPAWTVNDIVGGKTIIPVTNSPLRQTALPNISPVQPSGFPYTWSTIPNAYRTCFAIGMPITGFTPTSCTTGPDQTIKLFSDATYGHRITIFSVPGTGSNLVPTLLIDGAAPPNGTNTGTPTAAGATWSVNVAIVHPYTSYPAANQSKALNLTAGGSYLVSAGWGQVGRGMIEKHRTLLSQARASGLAGNSETVLGETLAVIGYSWLAENATGMRLADGVAQNTTQFHHGVGITAQTAIQSSGSQGPYVDLPLNFISEQTQTYSSSCPPTGFLGPFFTTGGLASSLESAVLEQTQALVPGMQAASTVRLVDLNAATGAKTYFADGTTTGGVSTYFSTIRPNLTATYATADLSNIDNAVAVGGVSTGAPTGNHVLIPANGYATVGLWHGAGYTITQQSCGVSTFAVSITQKISGGLSGGYSGEPVPSTVPVGDPPNTATLPSNTEDLTSPQSAAVGVTAAALPTQAAAGNPTIAEPVDGISGTYLYQHADLTTGSGGFPYALSFERNYSSASYLSDQGLGNGWTHNFSIAASRVSDPYIGLGDRASIPTVPSANTLAGSGESSAIGAASAIAATFVAQDLLSGTLSAQNLTLAWMGQRWLTDQLTNNAVMVAWPTSSEEFTWLPHADGSPAITYNPPPGSAVTLTGTVPDTYGNPTTFTYLNKDRSQIAFSAIGSAGNGQIGSWTLPSGMSVNFTYGYSYNSQNYLSAISNSLGRSLNLSYSGAHVTSVSDDTGRAVSYGYAATNDLISASDPVGAATTFAYDRAGTYDSAGHLTQIFYPANPGNAFVVNWYDGLGRVSQQANANGASTNFYFAGARTEVVDPAGDRQVTYQTARGKVTKSAAVLSGTFGDVFNDTAQTNGVVNVASSQYDGQDRLLLATAPEGGTTGYSYSADLLQNVTQITQTAKPGSGLAARSTSYAYDPLYNKPTRITDPLGLVSSLSYDPATGNLVQAIADVGGTGHFNAVSRFTYTAVGQVATATDPLGTVTASSYDARGNRVSITRDSGRLNILSQFAYDALGNVIATTDPNGNVTTAAFDADRRPTSVTLPATGAGLLVTAFTYDANGQRLSTQQTSAGALLAGSSTAYTLTGKAATTTDANGNVTRYAYDTVDRLSTVTDPIGNVTTFGYDALSRKTTTANAAIQANPLVTQAYTPDGLLASLAIARGNTVADTTGYAYDGFDRLGTATYPDSSTETYSYDADSNLLTRKTRRGDSLAFAYDTLNRLCTKTYVATPVACGGTSTNYLVGYAYDLDGRLIAANDNGASLVAPSASASYGWSASYDAVNRPIALSWTPTVAQTTPTSASSVTFTHGYDADSRRISQAANDNSWLGYPAATSSTSTAYTANSLNQYSAVGAVTPTYDGDGNLTYDGTYTYAYDVESRLTSIKLGAATVATYAYDAQGRRKTKTNGAGTTTAYVTDADNREVVEYDGSAGTLQAWYAFGPGQDEALNQMNVVAGSRATLIPDIQGSLIGQLASGGTLTKTAYQPFGESTGTTTASSGYYYTGRRLDAETVGSVSQPSGLYYYRARTYSPTWGRFLQADPAGYGAGPNIYSYALNSPLNLIDPFGLTADAPGLAIGPQTACDAGCPGSSLVGGQQYAFLDPATQAALANVGRTVATVGAGATAVTAAALGVALDLIPSQTAADDTTAHINHYTTAAGYTGITQTGTILPSSDGYVYLTPDQYNSGAAAQSALATSNKPIGYFQIPSNNAQPFASIGQVQPANNQPGGGTEVKFQGPVSIAGAKWVPIKP